MMLIAGRRGGDLGNSVECANMRAGTRRHRMPSARPLPSMEICELAPTTEVRAVAPAKYTIRFRVAVSGIHHSGAEAPRRSSSTKSLTPPTDRRLDDELPITATSIAGRSPRNSRFPTHVRTPWQSLAEIETSRAQTPCSAGCEFLLRQCCAQVRRLDTASAATLHSDTVLHKPMHLVRTPLNSYPVPSTDQRRRRESLLTVSFTTSTAATTSLWQYRGLSSYVS